MGTGKPNRPPRRVFHHETFDDSSVVTRLRRGLAEAGLDCACRDKANALLDRIGGEVDRATRDAALGEARKMRDAILVVVALLGELDDLGVDELDKSAFGEIAALFRDLSDFADHGADSTLRAAGQRVVGH
jgi:hypothetical protein